MDAQVNNIYLCWNTNERSSNPSHSTRSLHKSQQPYSYCKKRVFIEGEKKYFTVDNLSLKIKNLGQLRCTGR